MTQEELIAELQFQLAARTADVNVLLERNAAISAEHSLLVDTNAELKAKLDAVPVDAISTYYDGSITIKSADDSETLRYLDAQDIVGAWLVEVER